MPATVKKRRIDNKMRAWGCRACSPTSPRNRAQSVWPQASLLVGAASGARVPLIARNERVRTRWKPQSGDNSGHAHPSGTRSACCAGRYAVTHAAAVQRTSPRGRLCSDTPRRKATDTSNFSDRRTDSPVGLSNTRPKSWRREAPQSPGAAKARRQGAVYNQRQQVLETVRGQRAASVPAISIPPKSKCRVCHCDALCGWTSPYDRGSCLHWNDDTRV